MGLSTFGGTKKEWEMENLCGLQGTKQSNKKRPLSSPIHTPSIRYFSRKEIIFFAGWLQWIQSDSNFP